MFSSVPVAAVEHLSLLLCPARRGGAGASGSSAEQGELVAAGLGGATQRSWTIAAAVRERFVSNERRWLLQKGC